METTPVTPTSEAISAREELLGDISQDNSQRNKTLAAIYAEAVRQWVSNQQQLPATAVLPPIPIPPPSWITLPHSYTQAETQYDAQYPGIPPLVDQSQTGPPVAAQYVPPSAPAPPAPGHVDIGPFLRTETRLINGQAYQVRLYEALPDDTARVGMMIPDPDGTVVHKVIDPTPWGVAMWYEGVAQ